MYAVIETGSKQFKVTEGSIIDVEKLDAEKGDTVEFDKVLLVGNDDQIKVGRPVVEKAKVIGRIINHRKDKKIIVFKYKAKKHYRRKKGHRQLLSRVLIEDISLE